MKSRQSDPAVAGVAVRGSGTGQRGPEEGDAVRVDDIRLDFVANVSHELKTPVGAVALLAEAVLDAADDLHQVRRFGNKILHEANRLGTLVTELIALSRLQTAERLPDLATVEVDDVVRAALARCRLAVESADMQITVDAPGGLLLTGDASGRPHPRAASRSTPPLFLTVPHPLTTKTAEASAER